ncbi:hypothetical protein [Tychonema sp. LEGE 07203]|nr:hypothetical protein [Tychonema sp. LEGE 07203]MBE9092955.1 hypothetical protein [Tychonema sp. LEGE 07203]
MEQASWLLAIELQDVRNTKLYHKLRNTDQFVTKSRYIRDRPTCKL